MLSLSIDAAGSVTDAKAAGAALPKSLGGCIEAAARLIKLVEPGKPTSIVVSLTFKKK